MDGVLIDATEWHYEALNKALGCFGTKISREEHEKVFNGLPTSKKLQILSEQNRIPFKLHELINKLKQKFTNEFVLKKCEPIFCHEYAITRLKKEGFKLAVASNSIRSSVELMMSRSNLINHFDVIMSASDVEKAKPHPEIYIKTCEKLKILPNESLILEDNQNGIKAAKAAGGRVLKICGIEEVNYKNIIDTITKEKS